MSDKKTEPKMELTPATWMLGTISDYPHPSECILVTIATLSEDPADTRYTISKGSFRLTKSGVWIHDINPSERGDAFIEATRWATLKAATKAANVRYKADREDPRSQFRDRGEAEPKIECPECKGTGYIEGTCDNCDGTGHDEDVDAPCLTCEATGLESDECDHCNGTGEVEGV